MITRETYELNSVGFPQSSLPLTFQHATDMVRSMGLRYLWIDTFCIIQDDKDDWNEESSRMSIVYANALFTIAANHAYDASGGLMIPAYPLDAQSIRLNLAPGLPGNEGEIEFSFGEPNPDSREILPKEPLSKRAWAVQERLISPRVLHFTSSIIFLECDQGCRFQGSKYAEMVEFFPVTETTKDILQIKEPLRFLSKWYGLVEEYTSRQLTYSSDRLPAMSGVARIAASNLGYHYAAGLWQDDLAYGLGWSRDGAVAKCSERATTRAPSWSWPCAESKVSYPFPRPVDFVFHVDPAVDWRSEEIAFWECVEVKDPPVGPETRNIWTRCLDIFEVKVTPVSNDHFGQLQSGYILAGGRIYEAIVSTDGHSSGLYDLSQPDRRRGILYPTSDFRPDVRSEPAGQPVHCLLLGFHSATDRRPEHRMRMLVLEDAGGDGDTFRRIGMYEALVPSRKTEEMQSYSRNPTPDMGSPLERNVRWLLGGVYKRVRLI
jgi:hypothetical protein